MTVNEAGRLGQAAERGPEIIDNGGTARLHLTMATSDYDHVRDVSNGVVMDDETTVVSGQNLDGSTPLRQSTAGEPTLTLDISVGQGAVVVKQ